MAQCIELITEATRLTHVVSVNLKDLVQEWKESSTLLKTNYDSNKYVVVERSVLNHLATEIMMLKEFLPTVCEAGVNNAPGVTMQLTRTEKALSEVRWENQLVIKERDSVLQRLQSLVTEFEKEKKDHFAVKCELNKVNQLLEHQSDYCTSFGLICCTLLWRASQTEPAIQGIIAGNKTIDFLQLVSSTLRSFIDSYRDSLPDESSKEMQFILSLCGTVTNIAASAYGRNYIATCSEGQSLVQVVSDMLSLLPLCVQSMKLRSLALMMLFNISINKDGLELVRGLHNIMNTLVWLIKGDTSATNKLHALQLVQSLLLQPHTLSLVEQVREAALLELVQQLTSSNNEQLSRLAEEVAIDIETLNRL